MNLRERSRFARDVLAGLHWEHAEAVGDLIAELPVKHIVRGLLFDRAANRDMCYVYVLVLPLYLPPPHLVVFNFSERLPGGPWGLSELPELIDAAQARARAYYGMIREPADFADWETIRARDDPYALEARALSLVLSNRHDEACDALRKCMRAVGTEPGWCHDMNARCRATISSLERDPASVQQTLLMWEAQFASVLRIQRLRSG